MSDEVLYDTHGAVATITLNRPEVLNALRPSLLAALKAGLERAQAEGRRCVVITGAGRGFSAGQDLGEVQAGNGGGAALRSLLQEHYYPVIRAIRSAPMPILAAINGAAAGAGLSLALACDVRIAMEGARLTTAFTRIGLVPDAGMAWTLPRLVGAARASRLVMRSEPISAEEARTIGLVDEVASGDQFRARVETTSAELAAGPTLAFAMSRQLMDSAATMALDALLDLEAEMQAKAGDTADHQNAVAAFLEKRPARFEGR